MSMVDKEGVKKYLIELVKHHKKHCNIKDCDISLIVLMLMANDLGLELSQEERKWFI